MFFIKKETLAQVFSCEFCEISKNTFSNRTPLAILFLFISTISQKEKNVHLPFKKTPKPISM